MLKRPAAYQALTRIAAIYKLESSLKELSPAEQLKERQKSIRSLVEEYFTWVKERLADNTAFPKKKTAVGLKYSVNQEKYLKVFLEVGEVLMDNSAADSGQCSYTKSLPKCRVRGG